MGRVRGLLVTVIVGALLLGGSGVSAIASISNSTGTNVQEGDNRGTGNQGGASKSGDAVGGQVTGVVSSGRTSVDARNVSKDSSVTSGDARASNSSSSFVGQSFSDNSSTTVGSTTDLSFINLPDGGNLQEGNNRQTVSQTTNATTGDGVAGEVIGVVTAAGGSTSVVAANTTNNSDVQTGDARSSSDSNAFVGLAKSSDEITVGTSDISNIDAESSANIQEGNNTQTLSQSATSTTGDGVAGQVIGAVSAGSTSIDANNTSDNVDVQSGDSTSGNSSNAFVGLARSVNQDVEVTEINGVDADSKLNLQEGNNRQTARQTATASTGDGVAGEVIGAVTSAGGSASIVAANTSKNSDVTTGDSHATNDSRAFVGLANADHEVEVSDILNVSFSGNSGETNIQQGDNRQTVSQSSTASTGDGVAGQVIGDVSAGRSSIDANNTSDDVSVQTGDAHADNNSNAVVGLAQPNDRTLEIGSTDISGISSTSDNLNVQEGNNRQTATQAANASTGDGVAGEVIGVVTSAGGSASVVAANTSRTTDVSTGDADASNNSNAFVGLVAAEHRIDVGDISGINCTGESETCNVQQGNNRLTQSQTANATSGDGVGGQVLGIVSAGATSLDARNLTEDSSAQTGDARATNDTSNFVGLGGTDDSGNQVAIGDLTGVTATNVQEGNNTKTIGQSADAASGDAVAGQVSGVVTSAGGSASAVLANTSSTIDSRTGDSRFDNTSSAFVGLLVTPSPVTIG